MDAMPSSANDDAAFVAAFLSGRASGAENRSPDEWCVGLTNQLADGRSRLHIEVSYVPEDCLDPVFGIRKPAHATATDRERPSWWRKLVGR